MYKKILTGVLAFTTACAFNVKKEETPIDIPKTPVVAEAEPDVIAEPSLPIPEPEPEIIVMESEELVEEEALDISEETIPAEEDIELLACTIYCEAGGDNVSDLCRYYVADTVLNRVDSPNFPNTIYEVLTAPTAYGRFHWIGVVWPDYSYSVWEQPAIERAYRIARDILVDGNHTWIYGNHYVYQSEYCQSEVGFYLDGFYFGAE